MNLSISEKVLWQVDDLEGLPDNGDRYEIIDGELFVSRSPHWEHQDAAGAIYTELRLWSQKTGLGQAAFAPGIIFSQTNNVIPDVVWVSSDRLTQLLDRAGHLTGSPELVVEVLSDSVRDKKRDRETKLKLYSTEGVSEYWIVDRQTKTVEVYRRDRGILKKTLTLFPGDRLTSPLLPEFNCEVDRLFA